MIRPAFTKITFLCVFCCLSIKLQATEIELNPRVFDVIDLNLPALAEVKLLHEQGQDSAAAAALLHYFKTRTDVINPELDMTKVKLSAADKKMADEALEHKFFAHKGYQPSYFYGDDIDWDFWPVKDNELRWQLHRHKWFTPLGKAFRITADEKYAQAWVDQYMDWIKKNPLKREGRVRATIPAPGEDNSGIRDDNMRFSWRPLEVSHRLQDQCKQFQLFQTSQHFTPAFFTQFLVNYYKHANHIMHNFSKSGNHLLFEAQRVLLAGSFFPEFKDAAQWRAKGIAILNEQIGKQVYADGFQYELCPHYHLASINIFLKALKIADANGFRNDFPDSYIQTMEKMIVAFYNILLPDYETVMFSDNRRHDKKSLLRNFAEWQQLFPENEQIAWFASEGKQGKIPPYLSNGFLDAGFFVFRNGWTPESTAMVLKAGPPAFWHCQPDNGTFDLYINGRNFFPDGGCYVYGGDDEVLKWRNWFRQTAVHKTLTLNNENLETTHSKTLLFKNESPTPMLVTENQSYKDLKHRRTVFFVNQQFFVILDESIGAATGQIDLHYQFAEGEMIENAKKMQLQTAFADGNNVLLQTFCSQKQQLKKEQGWISYDYMQKTERPAYAFQTTKQNDNVVRYISVIYPINGINKSPKIKATFANSSADGNTLQINVTIGKEKYILGYQLSED